MKPRWFAILCPCGCNGPMVNERGEAALFLVEAAAREACDAGGVGEVTEVEITPALEVVRQ